MDVSNLSEFGLMMVLPVAIFAVPLFLVVLVITSLGRRWLTARARYALWSIVLLRLLLLISIVSPFSMQLVLEWDYGSVASLFESRAIAPDLGFPKAVLPDVPLNAQKNGEASQSILAATPQVSTSGATTLLDALTEIILPAAIMLGMLLMTVWSIITTARLYRRVASGTECRNGEWLMLLAEGQRLFGVSGHVSLRTVPRLNCPATYGWWRPAILLPEDAATWSTTELRHVFWHELAHISRHDIASNWLLAVIRALHWWNPLFWYAQSAWTAERELVCDALVLRFLGGQQSSEYGRTLLRFLERLNRANHGLPTSIIPGFVHFLGQKRVVRRRLAQLGRPSTPESAWRRISVAMLILALILTGLTDAAFPKKDETRVTAIDLPPGTTLRFLNFDDTDAGPDLIVCIYDLTERIARLQRDNPELTAGVATRDLSQQLQRYLDPSLSTCRESGNQLIVRATQSQHDRISTLLDRWTEHGQSLIQIEIMILTTDGSLKEQLPEGGGDVLQTGGDMTKAVLDVLNTRSHAAHSTPVFRQILTPQQVHSIVTKYQQDPRKNVLYIPKVTSSEGVSVTALNGSLRPFATGLPSADKACQVTEMPEGVCLNVQSYVMDHQSIAMNVQIQRSEIRDVEVLRMQAADKTVNLQLPQVSQAVVKVAGGDVPAEHSLLVAPLRRDFFGRLEIFIITPKQVQ